MKQKILFAAFAATVFLFAACKKDDPAPTPADLSGTTWKDSASIGGIAVAQTYVLNANGMLSGNTVSIGGTFANSGTWSKTPNSNIVYMYFTIATVPGTYTAQGTLDANQTKIVNGTATNSSNVSYNFSYILTKM